ncbi:MAG TPA: hypothetical protein VHW70_02705 [Edaphobacter sp.]|jgi:hypothetical protein|nr:hypothetical protein [Edaphobacter sp.]
MIPLRIAIFASIVSSATLCFAADASPRNLVVVCQPNHHCIHHTIFGHDYRLLNTDRFAVMVYLSNEGRYTRADVSITNLTRTPIDLSPESFRIEALVRPRVFPYVSPSRLETTPATPYTADPNEIEAATPHLKAITIPPNQAVHGRVYFERDPATTRQPVNVVLPIAGTIFKFPDIIKP